jgi:hypothetical protein
MVASFLAFSVALGEWFVMVVFQLIVVKFCLVKVYQIRIGSLLKVTQHNSSPESSSLPSSLVQPESERLFSSYLTSVASFMAFCNAAINELPYLCSVASFMAFWRAASSALSLVISFPRVLIIAVSSWCLCSKRI